MTPPPVRQDYGNDAAQFGELYRPREPAHPGVVVVIHGGFWQARYDLSLGRPLARDLADRGYTVWNLEYRRVGRSGGWPSTAADVADGIDLLAELDVDASRVVAIGHSAGGQLATWAAGRAGLPAGSPGAEPRVAVTAVVAQAGVLDLAAAARRGIGSGAVLDWMGGMPDALSGQYRLADPIAQVPLTAPVLCVHARADDTVPFAQSQAYVAAACAAGARAELVEAPGDHYTLIEPDTADWQLVVDALPGLLAE